MGELKTIWLLSLFISVALSQNTALPEHELDDIISQIFGNNTDVFATPPISTIPDTTSRHVETTIPITNRPQPTDSNPTDSVIPTTGVYSTNIAEPNVRPSNLPFLPLLSLSLFSICIIR